MVVDPRGLALRHVLLDPVHRWKRTPEQWRRDKEFVLAVVRQAGPLPPKSDFERAFPQYLRLDRDVVLAFCERDDFEQIYQERHLFVPSCFTNDPQVMMAYCAKIPRQLQECSAELCDDPQVVRTAVQRNGLDLQYASHRWQQDEEMLRVACARDGRALEFCPMDCPAREKLLADKEFLMNSVFCNGGAVLYRRVQDCQLKQDRDLLLCAVNHGLEWRYVPRQFHKDPGVVAAAVAQNANIYLELQQFAPFLQENVNIARASVLSPTSNAQVILKASQCAPSIFDDVQVAYVVADRAELRFLSTFLQEHAQFVQVHDVMRRAVERHHAFYSMASAELKENVDIVLQAIGPNSAFSVLSLLSPAYIREHPEVVVKAVQEGSVQDMAHFHAPLIPRDLWVSNRELQMAWIRRGFRVPRSFEDAVRADREMALLVAEHCPLDFGLVGGELRMDRDFMIAAVSLDGRVLQFATWSLLRDWELLVRAVANNREALDSVARQTTHSELKRYCKRRLEAHTYLFVGEFLRGIAAGGPGCTLTKLDCGFETGNVFKRKVAEFLGIPFGSLLEAHRKCYANLNISTSTPQESPSVESGPSPSRRRRRSLADQG